MKNRIQLLGINIDPLTMNETISVVEQFVSDKRPLHLMGVNADKINQCHSDDEIKRIVNESEVYQCRWSFCCNRCSLFRILST